MDIQPDRQNLDTTFATTVYYIDFYQREYKWTEEPVRRLLDDIFYQFDTAYMKHNALDPSKETVNARFPWYYLNTYVTNTIEGKVFVVDGQQRLTMLTLILIKLFHLADKNSSKTKPWLERKIAGYSGTEYEFWMNHINHIQVLRDLLDGKQPKQVPTSSGVTAVNMVKNYEVIEKYLDEGLKTTHRIEMFIHYFLYRLVLINLSVDQTHVPMVFEVINDRGVRLKPHEILKGKLLGQIDKIELDKSDYNALWDNKVSALNKRRDDEIDNFFRHWLKAKFSDNRKAAQRFDADYHREMFKEDLNQALQLEHSALNVKNFLKNDFMYYAGLYERIWDATEEEDSRYLAVYYNDLNELESQFMLIMSACTVNDPDEAEKIRVVSAHLDRFFSLLQLQGAYDSNQMTTTLYEICAGIRNRSIVDINQVFDNALLKELSASRAAEVTQPFTYPLFKTMSIDRLNKRFVRYAFGRVEQFIADGMRLSVKQPIYELTSSRGAKTGFHIEHILSYNDDNLELFGGDQELFEQERNRLGGVLLLKGRDNISSSNENFSSKLKSYANTLYWNETLRADTYQSKLDFRDFCERTNLNFRDMNQFGPQELEERHQLLFDIISRIWSQNSFSTPA